MKKIALTLCPLSLTGLILMLIGCGGGDPPYSPIASGMMGTIVGTPDFALSVQNPSTIFTYFVNSAETDKKKPGGESGFPSATFPVTLKAVNGFTGPVTLSAVNDQGSTAFNTSFTSPTVTIGATGSATTTFNVQLLEAETKAPGDSSAPFGTYTWTITGKSGTLTHSASTHAEVIVAGKPTFAITTNPDSSVRQTVFVNDVGNIDNPSGAVAKWSVTFTAVNSFTGTITLSSTIASEYNGDFTTSFSQPTVTLSASNPSATVTFTVKLINSETPLNALNPSIGGVSGNISVGTYVELAVGDDG